MLSDMISYLVVGFALVVTGLRFFFEKPSQPIMPIVQATATKLVEADEALPSEPTTEAAA